MLLKIIACDPSPVGYFCNLLGLQASISGCFPEPPVSGTRDRGCQRALWKGVFLVITELSLISSLI